MAKILVADDNSNIQKMVGLALKDQGIDVVAVGNGEAAVRKISDVRPDLVLADVFMPVRNGYEVCKYVKEDSTLSHIPVILLVGAFDPLDEQEAQRVGADGVLKKPFVPPDPLISMVKSALARAGVSLGPPAVEKAPDAAQAAKFALPPPAKLPEAEPEALPDDFPTPPQHLKIAAGQEPVAFGSMLETEDAEDPVAFVPKAHTGLEAERDWGEESDEVEEEVEGEDESARSGWRPGGLDEVMEQAAAPPHSVPDWHDEAFHGSAPTADTHPKSWVPAAETAHFADSTAVAVTTIESKPADAPVPFSGDAWAAAMAAGVEEKIAQVAEALPEAPAEVAHHEPVAAEAVPAAEASHEEPVGQAPVVVQETANNWFSISSTPWESEAQKASLMAATWDTPATEVKPEEPLAAEPEIVREGPAQEAATPFYATETAIGQAPDSAEVLTEEPQSQEIQVPEETQRLEPGFSTNSWETARPAIEASPNETQEVPVFHAPALEEALTPLAEPPAPAPVEEPKQPDMDELVARVLQKMNPDVLQKVTRDILRPVIEAIIQDELNSKKS